MTKGKNKKKKLKEQPKTEQNGSPDMEGLKLGDMIIEPTDSYKYLGETINNKGNMTNQIVLLSFKVAISWYTKNSVAS